MGWTRRVGRTGRILPVQTITASRQTNQHVLSRRAGRVVSMVHASLVVPLAFRCLGLEALERDRAFGWDYRSGLAQSVAVGFVHSPRLITRGG